MAEAAHELRGLDWLNGDILPNQKVSEYELSTFGTCSHPTFIHIWSSQ